MSASVDFAKLALELDGGGRPVEAAWAYEVAISSDHAEIELFLNLAVIYFQSADFGYSTAHHLPKEFSDAGLTRAFQILTIGENRFGDHTEIEFWKAYFSSVYLEAEGIEDRCSELLRKNDSLLPFMYLFVSGENHYAKEARELLETVKNGSTERERYIKSIVEAAFLRSAKAR